MDTSDKENDSANIEYPKNVEKIEPANPIENFCDESDSDTGVGDKSRKAKSLNRTGPKVYKVCDSDESDDNECTVKVEDDIYNTYISLDNYESPNLDGVSFESQENNSSNGVRIVLGTDIEKNQEFVVHPKIAIQLKTHQIDGLKFLFKSCYSDLNASRTNCDQGCILAHCMGLGKTLQLIALLHTVIRYPQLKTQRILVICPKSTVLNWKAEIDKWLRPIKGGRKLKVFTFLEYS